MLNCLFGNYLVENALMSQEQLDSLIHAPKEARADLSTIAVVKRSMSASQVQTILSEMDSSKERFGEVVVDEGIMSDDAVEQLLSYKTNSFMIFVQLLVDNGIITLDRINSLMTEFQNKNDYTDAQMDSFIADDLEEIVNIFVPLKNKNLRELTVTLVRTFRRIIDSNIYLEKAHAAHSVQIDHYASQMINGDFLIKVFLSGTGDNLLGVANYFTGDTYDAICDDALDNVGEFINCIDGQFATNLSYDDISIDILSPEYAMDGPFISNGTLFVIPLHVNGYSIRAVYEVLQ